MTCGQNHMKWWYLNRLDSESLEVLGKPGSILEAQRNAHFVDFQFGALDGIFCVTSGGVLCSFSSARMMEKWVRLESSTSYSIALLMREGELSLFIGCSDGIIRVFTQDLTYSGTLPLPYPLANSKYPACYAVSLLSDNNKLAAIYADRQLIVWDLSAKNLSNSPQIRFFRNHFSCIWDVCFKNQGFTDIITESTTPVNTFITCSQDHSIKYWGMDTKHLKAEPLIGSSNAFLGSIDFEIEEDLSSTDSADSFSKFSLSDGFPDGELPDRSQSSSSPRCVAVHPMRGTVACGDRKGRLHCFDQSHRKTHTLQAHSSEVLTICFSPIMRQSPDGQWSIEIDSVFENQLVLLASGGRDRLIHVFNALDNFSLVTTLDHHSSSVTAVKFTSDGKRLISCSGDKTIVFCSVDGPRIIKQKSVTSPHGSINGLSIDPVNKFAATSGQDKRLNIWNVQTGKHVRAYKHDSISGELYRCDIDPSGFFFLSFLLE